MTFIIILFSRLIFSDELKLVISKILCSVFRHGAITGLTAETAWSGLVSVDFTFLLPPLRLLTVPAVPAVSSPPSVPQITHLHREPSSLGPLGTGSETPSDPRLGSFHRPLEVLVLHSEGLGHVLPPESVPALLEVLPAHPQPLDSGALPGLQAATCCSSDVEQWRRVRSERGKCQDTSTTSPTSTTTDLSVSGVRVPSMSE